MAEVIIKNLNKSFDEVEVIKNISIEIRDGEFLSFLGPSGCGKTTMLRMVAGFEDPTSGDIYIGKRLVSSVEQNISLSPENRNISMVFQNYAVWPHMNVFKNVGYPLKVQGLKKKAIKEKVERVLELVKMEELGERYPSQLSGGQQQRVALARALIMDPDVMLLDEPLSNLDAKLREEMRFEIKEIHKKLDLTIIYVTHDQTEAMAMSDRILLLHEGRIQQIGSPRDLYNNPSNKFAADFIGLVNFIPAEIIDRNTEGDRCRGIIEFIGTDLRMDIRLPDMDVNEIIFAIRPENIKIVDPDISDLVCTIDRKVYLGNIIDYRIKIGDAECRVEAAPEYNFSVGEKVGLKFNKYVVFPNS
ncbi:MAG: ABC transporter ATP-binding protein [Halanaerobiales bacterium]